MSNSNRLKLAMSALFRKLCSIHPYLAIPSAALESRVSVVTLVSPPYSTHRGLEENDLSVGVGVVGARRADSSPGCVRSISSRLGRVAPRRNPIPINSEVARQHGSQWDARQSCVHLDSNMRPGSYHFWGSRVYPQSGSSPALPVLVPCCPPYTPPSKMTASLSSRSSWTLLHRVAALSLRPSSATPLPFAS